MVQEFKGDSEKFVHEMREYYRFGGKRAEPEAGE
jgi:hypothetical protein